MCRSRAKRTPLTLIFFRFRYTGNAPFVFSLSCTQFTPTKKGFKNLQKLPLLPFIQASRQMTGYCFTYETLYKSTRTFSQLEKNSFHFCGLSKKTLTFVPNNNNQCSLRICQKICLFKQVDLLNH